MTDERITELGRLVAELHAEVEASENPYAGAKLDSDLAAVGIMRIELARTAARRWFEPQVAFPIGHDQQSESDNPFSLTAAWRRRTSG